MNKVGGVVLISSSVYYQSLESLFSDKSKFRLVDKDPTLTQNAIYNFWLNVEMKMCTQNLFNINTLRANRKNIKLDIYRRILLDEITVKNIEFLEI